MPMNHRLMRPLAGVPMPTDADAVAYVLAVNAADGQSLEKSVVDAIDAFVIGCKADGNWSALKSACILSGARTLEGALTPLKGAAPTSFNFVSGDYSRSIGLKGDGVVSLKWLDTKRLGSDDPQDSHHLAAMITEIATGPALSNAGAGVTIGISTIAAGSPTQFTVRNHTSTQNVLSVPSATSAFFGHSRVTGSLVFARRAGIDYTVSQVSSTPATVSLLAFASYTTKTAHRMSFYSIGEQVSLNSLETRVLDLMTAFASLP